MPLCRFFRRKKANANIYQLLDLHFKASKRQDFAKCLAIEEVFTDINYHFEAGALKEEGFRVLLSAEGKRTMNFSYETGLGFYLGSEICPVNFEAMQEYCDKFCVDDEVDRLRQYRSFREQCSIRGMLEEVEQYHAKVTGALFRAL